MENELKCLEALDEPSTKSVEKVIRLSCHIDNGNKPVDMMSEGLKVSLEGQIEKYSPSLDRNALYSKTSKINKLVSLFCSQ